VATLSRLEWKALAAPWQACIEEAWTSYREGSVPIGAAILDAEGRLAATGRNHRAGGGFEGSEPHGQRLAHAELTALFQATAAHTDLRGFSLYSTMEPCPLCTGALAMARVGVVHFAARDLFAGSLGLLDASAFLRSRQVRVEGPFDARLEELMLALNADFWLRQTTASARRLIELWRVAFPSAVELGELLHSTAVLEAAAREALPARDVLALMESTAEGRHQP
jgi:tRNA(Arg) A34 adenosine deaminase TadA